MSKHSFYYLGPSGGFEGQDFSDAEVSGENIESRRLTEIRVRAGAWIDAIQTVYENRKGQKFVSSKHGGMGGRLIVFTLHRDEYITRITGKYGKYIDSITVSTNRNRTHSWGGSGGGMKYEYNAPPGSCIQGFFGRSDKYLSAIGVILKRAPRRRRQQGPSKVTSTVGQSSISGIISGNRQYAKKVGITSIDIPGYRSEANVDVNGRYKFSNLRNGRYRVYPIPGGKFSLISEPEHKIVNCEGSSSYTINFKIISIMEG